MIKDYSKATNDAYSQIKPRKYGITFFHDFIQSFSRKSLSSRFEKQYWINNYLNVGTATLQFTTNLKARKILDCFTTIQTGFVSPYKKKTPTKTGIQVWPIFPCNTE